MTRIDATWVKEAAPVCAMLTEAGHQAWFVGGCVRNALLNEPVADIDICTTAHPETVIALAQAAGFKSVPTGIDHGTVTVVGGAEPYEVTTLRRDVATDGRRAVVAFADTITEDALRRDFTMNAIYARPDGVIEDPLGGLPDLQARHIRFIEDPDQRIREDYLRILRFFRFFAWYGRDGIDAEGLAACAAHVDGIDSLSKERIGAEMLKLLAAPDPAPALASMAASGVLLRILPGAVSDVLAVLIHVEENAGLSPDAVRRLACIGGQDVQANLRLSKDIVNRLEILGETDTNTGEFAYRNGASAAIDRLAIQAASLGQDINQADIVTVQHAATQVFPLKAADLMPDLEGAALGRALKSAEAKWIASGFVLTKDDLLA